VLKKLDVVMNNGYLSSRPFFGLCLMEGDSALLELKQRRRPDQANG
jgi:hypothetical protein